MSEIKIVRLGALEHDPVAIAGNEARLTKLDDLLASIPAHGLNQSLRVRPWAGDAPKPKGKGKKAVALPLPEYGVIAGNRRLATLRRLRDEGAAVLGVAVTDDWPVPVIVGKEDDAAAFEITSAENVQRLALSPVEEFRAFYKMAERASVKEVAAHFGVPEKRVQQRLRLAALHPEVLAALESGKIDMAAAEAFAAEPDPAKQVRHLRKAKNYELGANSIRRALTEELIKSDSPIAKLIGKKAYVEAGGQVFNDLFGNVSYWINPDVVDRLLESRMAEQKAAWIEDGWAFVETTDQFGKDRYGSDLATQYGRQVLRPAMISLPSEIDEERSKLEARRVEMLAAHPELEEDFAGDYDEDWWDGDEAEEQRIAFGKIEDRLIEIGELAETSGTWSPEQKMVAGVVYWPDGSHEPVVGITRPGAKVSVELGGNGSGSSGSVSSTRAAATLANPGDARVHDLSAVMTKGDYPGLDTNRKAVQ